PVRAGELDQRLREFREVAAEDRRAFLELEGQRGVGDVRAGGTEMHPSAGRSGGLGERAGASTRSSETWETVAALSMAAAASVGTMPSSASESASAASTRNARFSRAPRENSSRTESRPYRNSSGQKRDSSSSGTPRDLPLGI